MTVWKKEKKARYLFREVFFVPDIRCFCDNTEVERECSCRGKAARKTSFHGYDPDAPVVGHPLGAVPQLVPEGGLHLFKNPDAAGFRQRG